MPPDELIGHAAAGKPRSAMVQPHVIPLSRYIKEIAQRISDLQWANPVICTALLERELDRAVERHRAGEQWHVPF